MSNPAPIPDLHGTVTAAVPIDHAFRVFTGSIGSWWPAAYHIGQAEMAEAVLEPWVGGRWYERGVDGSECDWGRVLTWEPPNRLVVTWQIDGQWRYDPDPAHASEIEVRFTARPLSSWSTGCWTGSSAARRSTTPSPSRAAAGRASSTCSPRKPPTRNDPARSPR
jgi:uncharacterized protein YndB with AHSA1/START domain